MLKESIFHFPKIEKITKEVTIVYFFLMFGYKLFSLYFPLFLVENDMSFQQVGYIYFLIYLPIALFSPLVGYLNHKINPAYLAFLGILGYGVYGTGMLLISPEQSMFFLYLFYFWQVLLGVSAALFFTSFRGILMGSSLKNSSSAFGWFYSAPFYASAVAPVFGALAIWRFGFTGVFVLSSAVHLFNSVYCLLKLTKPANLLVDIGFNFSNFKESIFFSLEKIKKKEVLSFLFLSLVILILAGFYGSFFVLFLKESLLWSENKILLFVATFSFLFMPVSVFIVKKLEKKDVYTNIFEGGIMAGIFTILIGLFAPFLNFFTVLIMDMGRAVGWLTANSSKSGLICEKLKKWPEEGAMIDTLFQPIGVVIGSLLGGFLIGIIGFNNLFIFLGAFVCIVLLIFRLIGRGDV